MALEWLKRVFSPKPVVQDPLWATMERMDPLLSYERFLALNLTEQQRPLLKGLIDGTVKTGELDVVRDWAKQTNESDSGIDALVFALQHVLGGDAVTYLFDDQLPFPMARFPHLVDESTLTILFNDRVNHLQICSLQEFLSINPLSQYTLEPLDLIQLRARIVGGTSPS